MKGDSNDDIYQRTLLRIAKCPRIEMWNWLPVETRDVRNPDIFKVAVKKHIWDNIPSY